MVKRERVLTRNIINDCPNIGNGLNTTNRFARIRARFLETNTSIILHL